MIKKEKILGRISSIAIILFLITIIVAPINSRGVINYSKADEINNLEISNGSEVVWDHDQIIAGTVTIKPLGTLIIKNGVTITFNPASHIIVNGKLFVNGTVEKPIYFKGSTLGGGYSIWINDGGKALIKHADISGPGMQVVMVQSL